MLFLFAEAASAWLQRQQWRPCPQLLHDWRKGEAPPHGIFLSLWRRRRSGYRFSSGPFLGFNSCTVPPSAWVDENTTYSAFCTKPSGRCFMARLDIQRTKITKQTMNTLEPIPGPDFIQQQMAEGVMYDDAADILEAPTTIGRMLFDPLNCIMHARVQAASAQHIFIFHNPLDHSLRVDARRLPELRAEPC